MRRLGYGSALGVSIVGVVYAAVLAAGMAITGFEEPIRDPVLAIMEVLTLVAAPLLVLTMAAVHASAPPELEAYSVAALGFMVVFAGLTSAVHFVGLTALRQLGEEGIRWPSALYAVELLAWDLFLGLALLCAAPVFRGPGLARAIRLGLVATGGLCIAGTLGPVTGEMRFQFIAVAGYGGLLPVVSFLVARDFRREPGSLIR
jgi:hypothetical protein